MMIRGAILLAFLAIASTAKASDVIYTGSRDIVVDLSVLGKDEDVKLKPEEVPLTEPKAIAKPKDTKPEKIILKKPPFTYKKPSYKKAKPAPVSAPASAQEPQKPKVVLQSPSLTSAAKPLTEPKPATKEAPAPITEKKEAKVAKKDTPSPTPAPEEKRIFEPKPIAASSPALKDAPAPLAAPVTAVEKDDIGDIIAKSGHVIFFDFAPSATGLTAQNKKDLEEVANTIKADNRLAIRLIAYAKNPEFASSKARRTSLSRALTIRDFLLKQDIPSSKIEVHALGNRVQKDQVFLEILAEE
jgi:outer membrane protein OmpA-like peptidoglycan-associated protein